MPLCLLLLLLSLKLAHQVKEKQKELNNVHASFRPQLAQFEEDVERLQAENAEAQLFFFFLLFLFLLFFLSSPPFGTRSPFERLPAENAGAHSV